jgi:anti-sigma regulatory factor (Ser/Thr protein kinase)
MSPQGADYMASFPRGFDIQLPVSTDAGGEARRALNELGLDAEMLIDARLLATELVTNSVRHAGLGPSDTIRVVASWSGRVLKLSVQDRPENNSPSSVAGAIRPSPDAESGWGLYFVAQIAHRWGYDAGRGYWFELKSPES